MPNDGMTPQYAPVERAPAAPTVEVHPAELIAPQVYERYSIAEALHNMFREAEEMAAAGMTYEQPEYWAHEYPSDTEAFRMYMQTVQVELKKHPAVTSLRQKAEAGLEITPQEITAVFNAYAESVRAAARRLREQLSPAQLQELKGASRDELDWNYRHLLIEHLNADEGAPLQYAAEDFFLILNPKARKIKYMESKEILTTLRHSMSQQGTDRLRRDVQVIREHAALANVAEVVADPTFTQAESSLN